MNIKRLWKLLMIAAFSTILAIVQPIRPAYACSTDEEGWRLMVLEAPFIAEGWIDKVTLRSDLPLSPYIPVELSMRTERVLKGLPTDRITFFDSASVLPGPGGQPLKRPDGAVQFSGASGACGILDEDVTGKYALMVFRQLQDGSLRTNRLVVAFGDSPATVQVEQLRQQVLSLVSPTLLPDSGGQALLNGSNDIPVLRMAPLVIGGVALLVAGMLLRGLASPDGTS